MMVGFPIIPLGEKENLSEDVAAGCPVPMEFVAINDTYGKSGKAAELLVRYGLTAKDIEQAVKKVVGRKAG